MDALPVTSDSDCPTPAAVQAEVRELTTPEQRAGVPADARVLVRDHGATLAVAITRDGKTMVRVYRDAARDCARRAHFVSVLAVVALMPPELGSDAEASEAETRPEPEPTPAAPTVTAPPPAPPRLATPRVRIELGARGDVSVPLGDTVRVALPGAALGVALGAGDLRFTLSTGYAPKAEARYTGASAGRAEVSRLELALGLRFKLTRAPLDTSIDASFLVARQELIGRSSQRPMQDTAFSTGGRVGLYAAWSERSLVSPFLAAQASLFPFAPAVSQLPEGTVGHLPYLWLGLSAGLALAL